MGARRAIFAHMIRAQCTHRALSSPALCVIPGASNMPYSSEKDRQFVLQSSWLYCGSSRLEHILASKIKIYGSAQRYFCEHDTCTMHSYRAHNSVRVRDSSWKKDEGTPVQTPQDISSSMLFLEPLMGKIPLKKIGTDVCGSQGKEVDCPKKLQGKNRTCTPRKNHALWQCTQ